MAKKSTRRQTKAADFVINPSQLGGIDLVSQLDGPGAGSRAAWVNTGSGLHYKVMIDRGLDLGQAFYKGMSLTYLSLAGETRPELSINRDADWLWGFYGGLMVTCGPSWVGHPSEDRGEPLSLHGRHSNSSATIESVITPDPMRNVNEMSITGVVRQGRVFGPNLELRRTISSPLGSSLIRIEDEVINRGNVTEDHAWLFHINLGYPLLEPGTQILYKGDVEPIDCPGDIFAAEKKHNYHVVPEPMALHRGGNEAAGYVDIKADRKGLCRAGVINPRRKVGLRITFSKNDFPRMVNWQHWGPKGDFVMGMEPANCGVEGRAVDRKRGWLARLRPGQSKTYWATIEVLEGAAELAEFKKQVNG